MSTLSDLEPDSGQENPLSGTLHVAFVGEVDHGKSTLLGRVLLDTGAISESRIGDSAGSKKLAFLLDGLREERDRLATLDTTQAVVEIEQRRYVLIDVPGHPELLKNMVSGASRAEIGVIVVDCVTGTTQQTLRHLRVLAFLGVTTVVCTATKIDLADNAEALFQDVSEQIVRLTAECGLSLAEVVPVSATEGHNVSSPAPASLPWYTGRPLLQALHQVGAETTEGAPLRFVVQTVLGSSGNRTVAGRVASGMIRPGAELSDGRGARCTVRTISRFGEGELPAAHEGDSVGLRVTGDEPVSGDLLTLLGEEPPSSRVWQTRVLVLAHTPVVESTRCQIRHASVSLTGTVERIQWIPEEPMEEGSTFPDQAGFSEFAHFRLLLDAPHPADSVVQCPPLGRFMLCDEKGHALALGIVDHVG